MNEDQDRIWELENRMKGLIEASEIFTEIPLVEEENGAVAFSAALKNQIEWAKKLLNG